MEGEDGRDLECPMGGRDQVPRDGRFSPSVLFRKDGVQLRFEYLFKLGIIADLAGAVLNKKLAPFAWIELAYWIGCEGSASLELRGSVVPSVQWYVEEMDSYGAGGAWSRKGGTEMERIEVNKFAQFVDTDRRIRGPEGESFRMLATCSERVAIQ